MQNNRTAPRGEAERCSGSGAGPRAAEARPAGAGSLPAREGRAAPGRAAGGQRPLTARAPPSLTCSGEDSWGRGEAARRGAAAPMPGGALRGRSRRLPPPAALRRARRRRRRPAAPTAPASCTDGAAHAPPPALAARRALAPPPPPRFPPRQGPAGPEPLAAGIWEAAASPTLETCPRGNLGMAAGGVGEFRWERPRVSATGAAPAWVGSALGLWGRARRGQGQKRVARRQTLVLRTPVMAGLGGWSAFFLQGRPWAMGSDKLK